MAEGVVVSLFFLSLTWLSKGTIMRPKKHPKIWGYYLCGHGKTHEVGQRS